MMEAAIADIAAAGGPAAGCGVAIFPRGLVVTCAHVVADALGVDRNSSQAPAAEIEVRFRVSGQRVQARVVGWSPLAESDIAVARVPEGAVAAPVSPVPLFHVGGVRGLRFRTYGFPRGYANGRWGYGELLDSLPGGVVQVRSSDLAPGFSGGPLQELQMGRVIGLLASYDPQLGAGFAISAAQIARVWPEAAVVRVESRFSPIADGLMGLPGDPLTGLENFLAEYLGTADRPRAFGGRQAQMAQLENWLRDPGCQTAMISAPAGRGKSALVTHWAAGLAAQARAEVAFVPVSIRFNTAQKLRVAMLLGARLRYLADRALRGTVNSSDPDQWLSEIGQRLREDRPSGAPPLVVVLDGMDEATDWKAGEDLSLPTALGSGVKILAAARTLAHDSGPAGWVERLSWPENTALIDLPPLDAAGVADVLRSMGNPLDAIAGSVDMIAELTRLSEGDPLLVSLYVEALRGSVKKAPFIRPGDLRSIPAGLDGYFEEWWKDQRRQWGAKSPLRESGVQALLNLLCNALGPLSSADIVELASAELNTWSLGDVVEPLSRFVIGDGQEQGFVFTHPRLGQYLYGKLSAREREQWNARFTGYGSRVLADLRSGALAASRTPKYVLQNLTAHLDRAGAPPESYYALMHENYVRAWEHFDGSFSGFLNDVVRTWTVAERHGQVDWQIRCTIVHSSLVGLRTAMPPGLICQALRKGLFTEAQVLGLLSLPTLDDDERSRLIALAAPLLSERNREAVFVKALDFDEQSRLRALRGLARHLPERRWSDLIDAAGAFTSEECRYRLLEDIAGVLLTGGREDLLDEALVAAQSIEDEDLRASLFHQLAPALTPGLAARLVEYGRRMNKPSARALALAVAAPLLPADSLTAALEAAEAIWYPYRRALALCAVMTFVAPDRRGGAVERALQAAGEIREPDLHAEALIRIAGFLRGPERGCALGEALRVIRDDVGGARRTKLLAQFPADLPPELTADYLNAASEWVDGLQRITFLTSIAAGQDEKEAKTLLEEALSLVAALEASDVPAALERIARTMPAGMKPKVVALASRLSGPAAIAVACHLPEEEQIPLLSENLPSLVPRDGYSESSRAWPALAELAERLPPRSADLVRAVLAQTESGRPSGYWSGFEDNWVKWLEAMALVTSRSSSGFPDEELAVLLESIEHCRRRSNQAACLEALSEFLAGERLHQAMAMARRIGDAGLCREALDALAGLLPLRFDESQTGDLLALAELALGRFPDSRFPAAALAQVLTGRASSLAAEARALFARLTPRQKAQVLAGAAKDLPPQGVLQLSADWLEAAEKESTAQDLLPGIGEIREVLPEALVPRCFARALEAGALELTLALAFRMPHAQRPGALERAGRLIGRIENPDARKEALAGQASMLAYLAAGEVRQLMTAAGCDGDTGLLAEIFPHLGRDAQLEILPELQAAAAGRDASAAVGFVTAAAPHMAPDELRKWCWNILESGELDRVLPSIVPIARHLDDPARQQFAEEAINRLGLLASPYHAEDDVLLAAAGLAPESPRAAILDTVLSRRWFLDDRTLRTAAPLMSPRHVFTLLERLGDRSRRRPIEAAAGALVRQLDAAAADGAIEIVRLASPSPERLSMLVALAALYPVARFLRTIHDSRVPLDLWDWRGAKLPDCLEWVDATPLAATTFSSREELGAVLRQLGELERPECLAVLCRLARGIVELAGAPALLAAAHSLLQVAAWWP